MSDLFGNHLVGFLMRRLILLKLNSKRRVAWRPCGEALVLQLRDPGFSNREVTGSNPTGAGLCPYTGHRTY